MCPFSGAHLLTYRNEGKMKLIFCVVLFLRTRKTMTKKSNYGVPLLLNVFLMCIWGGVKGGKFYKLDIWFNVEMNSVICFLYIYILKLSGSFLYTKRRKVGRKRKAEGRKEGQRLQISAEIGFSLAFLGLVFYWSWWWCWQWLWEGMDLPLNAMLQSTDFNSENFNR